MHVYRVSSHPAVRWWWSMDKGTLGLLIAILFLGGAFVTTASVGVAPRYDVEPYYFAQRQWLFLTAGLGTMLFFSLFSPKGIKWLSMLGLLVGLAALSATLIVGVDVKGANRWISLSGLSIQPSELLKPVFIVATAMLLNDQDGQKLSVGFWASALLMAIIGAQLLLQPDFGMFLLFAFVWAMQVLVAGIPFIYIVLFSGLGLGAVGIGYMFLPHVQSRIDRFLDPASGDTYQIDQAREAFLSGGLFGQGVGEGVVKTMIPDAHTDFIFAVIGEEFGLIACALLLFLYAAVIYRGMRALYKEDDKFVLLAGTGLLVLLGTQVFINTAVALSLLPTTGMVLPFISYGGSGTLSMAMAMGFMLAFLRRRNSHAKRW